VFKRFSTNYTVIVFLLDLVLIQVALQAAEELRFVLPFGITLDPGWPEGWVYYPNPGLHIVIALLWILSFLLVKIIYWIDEVQRLFLAHSIAASGLAAILYMANRQLPRLAFLYFYVLVLVLLLGYRATLRAWYRLKPGGPLILARVLIVGAGPVGQRVVDQLRLRGWRGIRLVGFVDDDPGKQGTVIAGLPVLGHCDEIASVVSSHAVDEVFIALPRHAHARLSSLVAWLWEQPVRVRVVPDYSGLASYGATIQSLWGITLIGLRDPVISDFERFAKRLMDIFLSGLGLLLLSPMMAVTAIAIKLESQGPVFYVAPRAGENGRPFKMIKFRSMVVNAEKLQPAATQTDEGGQLLFKTQDDPRVTRVGRFMRWWVRAPSCPGWWRSTSPGSANALPCRRASPAGGRSTAAATTPCTSTPKRIFTTFKTTRCGWTCASCGRPSPPSCAARGRINAWHNQMPAMIGVG
jgi:hypothetical protein